MVITSKMLNDEYLSATTEPSTEEQTEKKWLHANFRLKLFILYHLKCCKNFTAESEQNTKKQTLKSNTLRTHGLDFVLEL